MPKHNSSSPVAKWLHRRAYCSAHPGDSLFSPAVARIGEIRYHRRDRHALAAQTNDVLEERVVLAEPRPARPATARLPVVRQDRGGSRRPGQRTRCPGTARRPMINCPWVVGASQTWAIPSSILEQTSSARCGLVRAKSASGRPHDVPQHFSALTRSIMSWYRSAR